MSPFAWTRRGLVYSPSGRHGFDQSHCHKPTPVLVAPDTIRVYFGVRDARNVTRTTYVDVDAADPTHVRYVHDAPVLDVGTIGAFDDSGANVSAVCRDGDRLYMYFIGWNPSTTVHTRNAIGVAVSTDNGHTFTRCYTGAVLDRTRDEPFYTGAVDVRKDGALWRMWYTSGTEWRLVDGKPEICYHIKYATSSNGVDWQRDNVSCIPPRTAVEATARPSVLHLGGRYHMWYSRRDIVSFRTDATRGYRGGYAVSDDGVTWDRQDDAFGIEPSPNGWDSETIAYPYVLPVGDRLLMFYNGNGFGRTGFGVAECALPEAA
ncbi:MAG: hypothetical protein MUF00_07925 [Gemmatimonadaceae bacterium]|jgi:hypothetical protein|nr:hypothetical protein [Gemmatimonadaceae bacterium]